MASRYRYSRLDYNKRQIRLLHLHPSESFDMDEAHTIVAPDDIRCTFSIASLHDEPSYEALSYVWGTTEATTLVLLRDEFLPVTRSLDSILRHLRQEKERVLWIDALCIDQSNVDERSHQVSEMHNIYSQASRVIAYLGQAWDDIDSTLGLMAYAGIRPDLHWDSIFKNVIKSDTFGAKSTAHYDSIARFFVSQWWTRVWTVQEYVLAKNVTFMRDKYTLDATVFNHFLEYCLRHGQRCCNAIATINSKSSETYRFSELFLRAHRLQKVASNSWKKLGFLQILAIFRSRTCSDPRDKIYGMLGIVPSFLRASIPIDYSCLPRDVYRDVIVAALKKTLMPLSYIYGDRDPALGLLSWVLDFSSFVHEIDNSYHMNRLIPVRNFFRASSNSAAHFVYTDTGKAVVRAIALDTIKVIVPQSTNAGNVRKGFIDACWQASIACNASSRRYAVTSDAFWRTLCGGVSASALGPLWYRGILEEDFEAFEKWLAWIGTGQFMSDEVHRFNVAFMVVATGRNFAVTDQGHIGWVPEKARQGDVVMLLSGGNVPYVLRPVDRFTCASSSADNSDCSYLYEFYGDAYIHGIMHGEAYDNARLEDFSLI